MNSVINILAKNPERSNCKSRMNHLLTKDERVFLSKEMLKMICYEISRIQIDKYLHVYPDSSGCFIKNLSYKHGIKIVNQSLGYLSKKIYTALNTNRDKYTKRIVIGADIPSLSVNEINDCLRSLDYCDLVIGPSKDNGFYLVGTKNQAHECFQTMELNDILTDDIINICHKQKIEYKLIRELKDIDTPSDLLNL